MAKSSPRLYLIPVLSKALDILELLQNENQPMTLEAIHRRTRVSKTTVYRVLKTFAHRGYISQAQDGTYRHVSRPKKLRFGFAGQSADMPFSVEVTNSLIEAAASCGVDLMVLDNKYDGPTAVKNAEEFIHAGVDLIIEFQVEHEVAPIIGDRIAAARIPLIAIDIPHPHATFFGVDNYRVGMTAGEALAQFAVSEWDGKVDWTIGLDLPEAGLLVQSRVSGAFEVWSQDLPSHVLDGDLVDLGCGRVLTREPRGLVTGRGQQQERDDRHRDHHEHGGEQPTDDEPDHRGGGSVMVGISGRSSPWRAGPARHGRRRRRC